MIPFSTGTGLERVGVVGLDLDLCWADLLALGQSGLKKECCNVDQLTLDVELLCKTRKKGGRRGLRP